MGAPERDTIEAMLAAPLTAEGWSAAPGTAPDEAAIDRVCEVFASMNAAGVARHATLIPDMRETVDGFRAPGPKIGSTAGQVG